MTIEPNLRRGPRSQHMEGIEPSDIRLWTTIIESVNGINLAQGTSFIEPGDYFGDLVREVETVINRGATASGFNTYSHASGVPALRQAIAKKSREFNSIEVDPDDTTGTVTVTQGATGGLVCALHAVADPGDEIILLAPFYGYHLKSIQMLGLRPVIVPLDEEGWQIDFDLIRSSISPRTRAIVINTPNNPTGKVFTAEELLQLGRICLANEASLISDEVYEFITYDGHRHVSPASIPEIEDSVITVGSFSKTLSITGWRLGYVLANSELTRRIRIANEMLYVCAPTPLQHAIAPFVSEWQRFRELATIFARKRSLLCDGLSAAGIPHRVPDGAYYVIADLAKLGLGSDAEINRRLIEKYRVAGVPGTAFYLDREFTGTVRFCFAVPDRDLQTVKALLSSA